MDHNGALVIVSLTEVSPKNQRMSMSQKTSKPMRGVVWKEMPECPAFATRCKIISIRIFGVSVEKGHSQQAIFDWEQSRKDAME